MSQTELARRIGVTFQQVQKYENGANRVGSGRLFKIASVFSIPVTAFFDGAEHPAEAEDTRSPTALLTEPYALRLLQAFRALESNDMRRTIADLVENIASCSTTAAPVPEGRATASAPAAGHFA
jgi:transcriptional regulator with XRE-family HTH domain